MLDHPHFLAQSIGKNWCTNATDWPQEFWIQNFPSPRLVTYPRLKSPVCPTILPIAGRRIYGFIPFPRVLALYEMQTALSRIWTQFSESIFFYDNHDTTIIVFKSCSYYEKEYWIWYIYMYMEARGIMARDVGNGLVNPSSNPRHGCLHFT